MDLTYNRAATSSVACPEDLGLLVGPNTIYVIGAGGIATNAMVMTLT